MALLQHNWFDTGKKIYQLSLYESTNHYYYPAHIHKNQAELVYCSRGEFTHRIGGVNYIHREGEMRLISEKDIHMLRGSNFAYFNLSFSSERLKSIASLSGQRGKSLFNTGPGGLIPLNGEFRESLGARLDKLFKWEESDQGQIPFTHFILELLDLGLDSAEDRNTPRPEWLNRALAVLNETLSLYQSLEASCRSREHFTRTFKKHMGISPLVYLNGLKMEKASRLLVRTNIPVKAISEQCQFENQNYFNRRFKEKFTMTPLEYRHRYLNRVH
jgi:AraC-like DNA-binding protein